CDSFEHPAGILDEMKSIREQDAIKPRVRQARQLESPGEIDDNRDDGFADAREPALQGSERTAVAIGRDDPPDGPELLDESPREGAITRTEIGPRSGAA